MAPSLQQRVHISNRQFPHFYNPMGWLSDTIWERSGVKPTAFTYSLRHRHIYYIPFIVSHRDSFLCVKI